MKAYIYKAKIINIVDGDTVDADIDLGFKMSSTQRLRLLGVDTPELTSTFPPERQKAQEAKAYTKMRTLNADVLIETHKSDSFGRYLADIYLDRSEKSFSEELLEMGYARPYKR